MPAQAIADFLKAGTVFAALPAEEIAALAAVAREDRYRAREYLFMEGDPSRGSTSLGSGQVKILRHSQDGKDIVLELLGPGEVFGGVAVIEKRSYPASAQATEPTVVVKIPADPVLRIADRHPAFIKAMALTLGRRLRAAHDSVKSLASDPVEARFAATLLRSGRARGTREKVGGGVDAVLSPHPAEPCRHERHHRRDDDPHRRVAG